MKGGGSGRRRDDSRPPPVALHRRAGEAPERSGARPVDRRPVGQTASAPVDAPSGAGQGAEGAGSLLDGARSLGVPLTPAQILQLETYLDLLQRWGRTYNLTAILDRPAMRVHHLLDSLALVPHLDPLTPQAGPAPVLLDVGSGAGLPGVVVAIARPGWKVLCVDAVAKKVGFIRQVAAELGLPNLEAAHTRIEQLAQSPQWAPHAAAGGARVITSRAFASLQDFLGATQGLLGEGGEWLAMKGQVPQAEIDAWKAEARAAGTAPTEAPGVDVVALQVPGLDAQRCLVRVRAAARAQVGP